HTDLKASEPVNRAMLTKSPPRAELTFTTPVAADATTLTVVATAGRTLFAPTVLTSGVSDIHRWNVPSLEKGTYAFRWVTIAKDGHRATGDI
ncbi:copper resistance protein CopC, partial [Klebsiella pneumoniae]|nr:copper resistance protein CopC [Klebsiella pneumoniae]